MRCLRSTAFCVAVLLSIGLSAQGVLAQPGALDPTFGDGGVVFLDADLISGLGVDDEGRIVASGNIHAGPIQYDPVVWRFLGDGAPDLTFGEGGVATGAVDGVAHYFFDVIQSPSGDVYAVGSLEIFADFPPQGIVARFGPGGMLDPSFGTGGVVMGDSVGVLGSFRNARVLSDGRVAVAGRYSGLAVSGCIAARLLSDGTPDPTFGDGGGVAVVAGPPDPEKGLSSACNASAFDESDRVVFATSTSSEVGVAWAGLRLLADGSVDPMFEPVVDLPELGLLLAVESSLDGHVTFGGINDSVEPTLIRFTQEGALDASFGESGVATLGLPGSIYSMDLALQPDGKLLIGSNDWVARVLADGTLDPAFGEGGVAMLDLSGEAGITSLVLDAEGRLVVGGVSGGFGFIARLSTQGAVSTEPSVQPERLALSAPAPNPALRRTSFTYSLAKPGPLRISVYDVLGREVAVIAEGTRPAGENEAVLDTSRLAPGLYIVRLTVVGETKSRRLTVVR